METGQMNQSTGRRVFVALSEGGDLSEIDLLKLLSEAEIDLSSVRFVKPEDGELDVKETDALVVPLYEGKVHDDVVQAAVLAAARAGSCHIVGVWAPGQNASAIHPDLLKYGTAQIPWEPERLRNELGSDCENAFQTPDGDEAEGNEIDPNECE